MNMAEKWEILTYHLKVICIDNNKLEPPTVLDNDICQLREEAYLTITMVSKLFKHLGFVSKQNADYKFFQDFISTMFQGLIEKKPHPW